MFTSALLMSWLAVIFVPAALHFLVPVSNPQNMSRDVQLFCGMPGALSAMVEPVSGFLLSNFGTVPGGEEGERVQYTLHGYRVVYGILPLVYLVVCMSLTCWASNKVDKVKSQGDYDAGPKMTLM